MSSILPHECKGCPNLDSPIVAPLRQMPRRKSIEIVNGSITHACLVCSSKPVRESYQPPWASLPFQICNAVISLLPGLDVPLSGRSDRVRLPSSRISQPYCPSTSHQHLLLNTSTAAPPSAAAASHPRHRDYHPYTSAHIHRTSDKGSDRSSCNRHSHS